MTSFTVTPTGRTWAAQSYNTTTKRWRDGGPELAVEILDNDSGTALADLTDKELLAVARALEVTERADIGKLADDVALEIRYRLGEMGHQIHEWNGENASELAAMLNDLDQYANEAEKAMPYVPGRPYGYSFPVDTFYDPSCLGWHSEREPAAARDDVYACDKHGVFVVLVSGTTNDGWAIERPGG